MRGRTIFASFLTLGFLSGFVFATFAAIAIAAGDVGVLAGTALGVALTVAWAFLTWLISPWLMDLTQRFLYKARPSSLDELGQVRPQVASFVAGVCQRNGVPVPRLYVIDDGAPQAYCYGSHAGNARLVVTSGLFQYLDDRELAAVYAHELGHIVHRDFIVMTIAATLLNVLWNVYVVARNIRGRGNSRPGLPVALVALGFYTVGTYLLLLLSRAREYYADEFAGAEVGEPDALSMALVKIAYGLTRVEPSPLRARFLGGTRAMGISDGRAAAGTGFAYQAMVQAGQTPAMQPAGAVAAPWGQAASAPMPLSATHEGLRRLEKVMLFDIYNPWGSVSELGSTHPLTGKRIRALGEQAVRMGRAPLFGFEKTDAHGQPLDVARLYSSFGLEVMIHFSPWLLGALFALVAGVSALADFPAVAMGSVGLILFGVGLGLTVRGLYRFGSLSSAAPASVLDLMSDPYASPLRGRPVVLEGRVIGRADAGNRVDEDFTIEDRGGGLMMINYESLFGPLGNLWFGWKKVAKIVGQPIRVVGWFRRGVSQQVDLARMDTTTGESVTSYTGFWGKAGGIVVLVIGLVVALAMGLTAASSSSASSTSGAARAVAPAATAAAVATQTAKAAAPTTKAPAVNKAAKPAVK